MVAKAESPLDAVLQSWVVRAIELRHVPEGYRRVDFADRLIKTVLKRFGFTVRLDTAHRVRKRKHEVSVGIETPAAIN